MDQGYAPVAGWSSPLVAGGRIHPLFEEGASPFHRPIDVRVQGEAIHVLDFGDFEMTPDGVEARAGTGALWRIPLRDL